MSHLLLAADTVKHMVNLNDVVNALVYTGLGVVVFGMAFLLMIFVMPFSVRKEIEEDQNTSLGIIMGSIIIGLALIIASAVHGG
jgi:putative membrane protein